MAGFIIYRELNTALWLASTIDLEGTLLDGRSSLRALAYIHRVAEHPPTGGDLKTASLKRSLIASGFLVNSPRATRTIYIAMRLRECINVIGALVVAGSMAWDFVGNDKSGGWELSARLQFTWRPLLSELWSDRFSDKNFFWLDEKWNSLRPGIALNFGRFWRSEAN